MTYLMQILAPGFERPAAEHDAFRRAREAWQRENAAAAEIASLSETIRASDPRILDLQVKATRLEEETNDAIVDYLDAIRDTRETGRTAHTAA